MTTRNLKLSVAGRAGLDAMRREWREREAAEQAEREALWARETQEEIEEAIELLREHGYRVER